MISEVFAEAVELATRLGVERIDRLPGCWEVQVDKQWWIAMNGHKEPTACSKGGTPIPPFHLYVEFNGFPAGVIGMRTGMIAAGAAANEDALIAALKAKTS